MHMQHQYSLYVFIVLYHPLMLSIEEEVLLYFLFFWLNMQEFYLCFNVMSE